MADLTAIWAETQVLLRRQMTQATYDTTVQPTQLVELTADRAVIHADTGLARDWLENRLAETVQRTLKTVLAREVAVRFINGDSPRPQPESEPPSPPAPVAIWSPEKQVAEADHLNAYFGRGTTGYDQVPHPVTLYKMPLLGPAYLLWRYLVAQDKRPLAETAPNFWTPPVRYSLDDLAHKLNRVATRYIGGDALECDYSRRQRQAGHPLTCAHDCCGSQNYSLLWFKPDQAGGVRCLHWSVGLLEILQEARLVRVERFRTDYKPAVQAWRLPSLLTPYQYQQLNDTLQTDYKNHLVACGRRFGLASFEEWEQIAVPYLEPLMPGYRLAEVDNNWRRAIKTKFQTHAVPNPKILTCMSENQPITENSDMHVGKSVTSHQNPGSPVTGNQNSDMHVGKSVTSHQNPGSPVTGNQNSDMHVGIYGAG